MTRSTSRRTMLAAAASLCTAVGAANAQTLDQENIYDDVFSAVAVFSGGFQAQTFTAGLTGTLSRVDLNAWASPGITGDELRLRIVTASAGIPDPLSNSNNILLTQSILLEDLFKDSGIPDAPIPVLSVDVSGQGLQVTAGTEYAIVLERVAFGAPPWVLWGSGTNTYANGNRWQSTNGGFSWDARPDNDYGFATFVDAGTGGCNPADLSSPANPGVPDGVLTGADFFEFLDRFSAGDLSIDFSSAANPGVPDGVLTGADFFEFLGLFSQGC